MHDDYESHFAKRGRGSGHGWVPKGSDMHPYLEIDLEQLFLVCGVEVQGCKRIGPGGREYSAWVTRYRVQVSPENEYWDSWNFIKVIISDC